MKNNSSTKTASRPILLFLICTLVFNLLAAVHVNAATINVDSIEALQNACDNSNSGDIIILKDGIYQDVSLDVINDNIIIKAQTLGGVFLNGYDNIDILADGVTFSGFQFTTGDIGTNYLIEVYGSHNILSQLNFNGYAAKKFIVIEAKSQYNTIEYCNISKLADSNKAELGCAIQVHTSLTIPGYHKISYCSFQNFLGAGGDYGNEPIRIGLSTENNNASRTIVEHCYFNNTGLGDSESVSVKSKENIIRFCTFTNQQNAMLCFRNGNNNVAYSNFFINAGGIRVKEANTIFCYNNYFENSGVGSSADAVSYVYDTTTYPVVLNNINFIHNTFVDCGYVNLGGNGAANNTWANNIFQKSSGSIFKNTNSGTTWAGNIYQGTLGITIDSGMTNTDPLLISNGDGYFGLSASSPAIDAASSSYPAILNIPVIDDDPNTFFDISGQERPSTLTSKDVGCDEYITGSTTNHPLVLSEVGPSYLGGPSLSINTNELFDNTNIFIFPNPAKTSFSIETSTTAGLLVHVAVYNLNGQLVKKYDDFQKQALGNQKNCYDVSDLNNGIYFVKAISENSSRTIKLIVKK